MNVSEGTIKAIHELNGECFSMNRYWDATVSVLGVTYVCSTASKLIHEHIAHWYPYIADVINERCLENFNIVAYYPATPAGDVVYNNLQAKRCISTNHSYNNSYQEGNHYGGLKSFIKIIINTIL